MFEDLPAKQACLVGVLRRQPDYPEMVYHRRIRGVSEAANEGLEGFACEDLSLKDNTIVCWNPLGKFYRE